MHVGRRRRAGASGGVGIAGALRPGPVADQQQKGECPENHHEQSEQPPEAQRHVVSRHPHTTGIDGFA